MFFMRLLLSCLIFAFDKIIIENNKTANGYASQRERESRKKKYHTTEFETKKQMESFSIASSK